MLIIPIKSIFVKIIQYISGKVVTPKLIPKLDFSSGIPNEYATMVVIPTIVKSKEKVKEIMKKLEVFFIANKSENIYFTLLGDVKASSKKDEEYDQELVEAGEKIVSSLNKKYGKELFHFIYGMRVKSVT